MKKIFLSVIVPAYNEEENILRGVLAEVNNYLKKQKYLWEVIIVDDGSKDSTNILLSDFVKRHKGFSLLRIPHSGKGRAVVAGFKRGKGEILLFTDFDQSVPIGEIGNFLPFFKKKYDIVIGSRVSRQGAPIVRKITGYGFIFLQKLLLGLPYKDTQCGFKAFTREAAQMVIKNMIIFSKGKKQTVYAPTAGFDLEILLIAQRMGLKVAEMPVEWRYRNTNKFNPLKVSLLALRDIINIRRIL